VKADGKPLLEYILKETAGSSIEEVICVISPQHKEQFEEYLSLAAERFPRLHFKIRIQNDLLGDGDAVLKASDIVEGKPFAVRFSDDLLFSDPPALRSLVSAFEAVNAPVILLEKVPREIVSRYGVVGGVDSGNKVDGGMLFAVDTFVEKPAIEDAPSNLTAVGGYVLPDYTIKDLQTILAGLKDKTKDSLRLADAFRKQLNDGKKIYGWEFGGKRLDCGSLEGFYLAEEYLKSLSGNEVDSVLNPATP
jgi:UTP--glucose-1-phosphate uridylyltransferase